MNHAFLEYLRKYSLIKIILPILNISEAETLLCLITEDPQRFIVVFKNDDNTHITRQILALGTTLIKQRDDGIYNAINLAVNNLDLNDFYIVMGSDDTIYMPTVKRCEELGLDHYTVYTAEIKIAELVVRRKKSYLLHAHKALVSEHAIGTILSKKLHNKFGLYTEDYIIASDAKFLMYLKRKNIEFTELDLYIGAYGGHGISTKKYVTGQLELISAIYLTNNWHTSLIMTLLILIRVIKNAII